MQKKYQIFISSTYEDLKGERQQAIKAILEMGHIPVGMEMFSAGDESQWQLIKRQIDDCDYYVVILAHRYGSLDKEISYTEKEYLYAVEIGIPVLGFILSDKARWPKTKIDMNPDIVARLNAFKEKIKRRIIDYWTNTQDLKSKVSIALMKQMNLNPRVGWMKASTLSEPEVLNEISRLSKENAEFRAKLNRNKLDTEAKIEDNKVRITNLLDINKITISFYYIDSKNWESSIEFTYAQIFALIAPELYVGKTTEQICTYLGQMLNNQKSRVLRQPYSTPTNTIKTIMADFSIMNLSLVINRDNSYASETWEITEFGKEIYAVGRLRMLEKNYRKVENLTTAST